MKTIPLSVINTGSGAIESPVRPVVEPDENQRRYDERVRSWKETPYLDYPMGIGFETLARCNAACDFCPYPTMDRKGERMPDELIEKFVDELADLPSDLPVAVTPSRVNEPFLDVRVLPMLEEIEGRYPNVTFSLFSNASPISGRVLERLCGLRQIRMVNFSFNDHRPDEYQRTMQIDFDRTVRNLDAIHEAYAGGDLIAPVIQVSRVGDGSEADDAFMRWCASRWPSFVPRVSPRIDWMGDVSLVPFGDPVPIACGQWFKMSILASGLGAFCAIDSSAERGIGHLAEHHVLEIYNMPERRRLREQVIARTDIPACRNCTLLA